MINWTLEQINDHKIAAENLDKIMQSSFSFVEQHQRNVTEFEVQKFIIDQFRQRNLKSDIDRPIVAFGQNTSNVHYFPNQATCRKLTKDSLIMIDIWAKKNKPHAPFADITWMGYFGNGLSTEIKNRYEQVIQARDEAISYIQSSLKKQLLPIGKDIDTKVRESFQAHNINEYFLHSTGHSLGFSSAHGKFGGHLSQSSFEPLLPNIGYTIEPGLYFENSFGIRSEIDFFINDTFELIITTKIQTKMIYLKLT